MKDLDAFARLTARVEDLERRLSLLEHPSATSSSASVEPAIVAAGKPATNVAAIDGGAFPIVGRAMLGIAGGYLLRAVAESGSFPKIAVVVLALAYAAMWLVWAARVTIEARVASAVYATTAALIFAPMLWELTTRFEVLRPQATAGLLVLFVLLAYALSWKGRRSSIVWIANLTAIFTTFALIISTHDLVPFICALLVMVIATEVVTMRTEWFGLRPVVGLAATLATWILLYIYSRPEGVPSEYKILSSQVLLILGCGLFLIYSVSIMVRTTRRRSNLTIFEISQVVVAFLLVAFSTFHFGGSTGGVTLGVFCLLMSASGYAASYACFDSREEQRNYHVFVSWSAALLLLGITLSLPSFLIAFSLSLAAVAATIAGVYASRLTLEFHGLAFLGGAAYASGLLNYAGRALGGTFPAIPGAMVWIAAAAAIACYAVGSRSNVERWDQRVLQLLAAMLAAAAAITFLVSALVWLAEATMTAGASQVAVIRTLIISGVALALAFSGSMWHREELVWIAYGALALVTAKLLLEDLQHGHPAATAISIFLYAMTLILVPRMARFGKRS